MATDKCRRGDVRTDYRGVLHALPEHVQKRLFRKGTKYSDALFAHHYLLLDDGDTGEECFYACIYAALCDGPDIHTRVYGLAYGIYDASVYGMYLCLHAAASI